MKSLLLSLLISSCGYAALAQQEISPLCRWKDMERLHPEVKRILQQQVTGTTAKQKTAAPELLVASSFYGFYTIGLHIDSTSWSYSGSRGSNLNNKDLDSYNDEYDPFASLTPVHNSTVPYLLYDTMANFRQTPTTPMYNAEMRTRLYNAANQVATQYEQQFSNTGSLSVNSYFNVIYTAGNISDCQLFVDTSQSKTGAFVLEEHLKSFYTLAQRSVDSMAGYGSRRFITYSYNTASLLATSTHYLYDKVNGVWGMEERYVFSYDGSGRLNFADYEEWNSMTNGWEPRSRDSFGYTGISTIPTLTDHYDFDTDWHWRTLYTLTPFDAIETRESYTLQNGNWCLSAIGLN